MSEKFYPNPKTSPNLSENKLATKAIKSKSALKREMLSLQKIGADLVSLSPKKLSKITMSEELTEAIMLARRLKNSEGKRRQMQYIGKIMRSVDIEKITVEMELFDQKSDIFHDKKIRLEKWKDRLISQGDKAIDQLLVESPKMDRKHLRQLTRQARKEVLGNKPVNASKKIIAYLIKFSIY